MECNTTTLRMLKYACPNNELSCIIGNLFTELAPPCGNCGDKYKDGVIIHGTTYTGEIASLVIMQGYFLFDGKPETLAMLRQRRCINFGKQTSE